MIGSLTGTLAAKQPPWLLLDVGGVGYELEAPMSTFYELPQVGSKLTLVTHLVVREDAQLLYGFSSEPERKLFRNLLKVSGIGARIALAVLSTMSVRGFHRCVKEKDLVSLVRIPGVGKKTAERLLVEMADRLPLGDDDEVETLSSRPKPASEAESALLALGYRPAEVSRMLESLDTAGLTTEALIKEALRQVHSG
ncbi:MAG: Holliday junction branch migration protein RuvA [Gammaproteobacteria bacterium]|nr:Holliday junction branch migration protein RuvA [Gammaproteobacteria bacterium]